MKTLISVVLTTAALVSVGQVAAADQGDQQQQHLQAQQEARRQQLMPEEVDVRLTQSVSSSYYLRFSEEQPCFPIQQVILQGDDAFPHWLPLRRLAALGEGQCLGEQGINLLMRNLQNRLIEHGYITSRILAPDQNLSEGKLILQVVPGKVQQVLLTPESSGYATLYHALPLRSGELLDLRVIEQGLENLQRLPTVQAEMEIIPGLLPGESQVLLQRTQSRFWRVGLSLDDSGSRATGRYQGGLMLALDNPLSLSDLFYVYGSHNLDGGGKGTYNLLTHYSVPFGYWQLSLNAGYDDYYQTVAGLDEDYRYSGNSQNLAAQLSRVLFRNDRHKTTLSYDVSLKRTKNFINDTEVEVQRRQTAAWRLGLAHRWYVGTAQLDAGISYQRGTRWFGADKAPEEYSGEATALSKILQINGGVAIPFTLGRQAWRYEMQYVQQRSATLLTPLAQFSIGNRWSVRGFDGESTLSASQGWSVRNDLSWQLPRFQQALYLGIDYGSVSGADSDYLVGRHLAGGVIGLRGSMWGTRYDAFVGVPLSKPDGFITDPVNLGFTLNWDY